MKDMLDREIVVGDTLAYLATDYSMATGSPDGRSFMATAKVSAIADFAAQLTLEGDTTRVISEASTYVICDWAKGSDVV
jgi:hypothetical protein